MYVYTYAITAGWFKRIKKKTNTLMNDQLKYPLKRANITLG